MKKKLLNKGNKATDLKFLQALGLSKKDEDYYEEKQSNKSPEKVVDNN
jgi:hypothetical protein